MIIRSERILTDKAGNETRLVIAENGVGVELRQGTRVVYVPIEEVAEFCRQLIDFTDV